MRGQREQMQIQMKGPIRKQIWTDVGCNGNLTIKEGVVVLAKDGSIVGGRER